MIILGRLQKAETRWLVKFFGTQHSVLGGVVPTTDLPHVQHQVMMIMVPQGVLKQFLEICFFVAALAITKSLVKMILQTLKPDMVAAVRGLVPEFREILWFSLKYMAVIAIIGGILILASYVLTPEHFKEIAVSKIFLSIYGLMAEGCLAWLLVPSAIRLLRGSGNHTVSTRVRQVGTIFAVAASAVSFGIDFLVGKAESTFILYNQWESDAIAVANSVIVNTPQILFFIALALLAIQTFDEEFFLARRNRSDRDAFRRILNREGGEPPRAEDEWVEG
jgi:hypothetical protein